MKIKFLGTAAYEGVPSIFCQCRVCQQSKLLGGKNVRSRSQALINDDLLIDFNADTVAHYQKYLFDWNKIGTCLITHSHCDHLYLDDIEIASNGYTHGNKKLAFYAAQSGYEKLKTFTDKTDGNATATLIEGGKRFLTADGKYEILPLWADHDPASSPVFYSVKCGNKKMLYAHDTGYFPEQSWQLLKGEGRFDLVSLDCTGCLALGGDWTSHHMSFGTNVKVAQRMQKEGLIDGKTVLVCNHFSHNGGQTYDEMAEVAEKAGYVVSYDGLEIEF